MKMLRILPLWLCLLWGLPTLGQTLPAAPAPTYERLKPEAFRTALLADVARQGVLLDVRTPGEYAEGHLAGARLINYYDDDFAGRVSKLDRKQTYFVYCLGGVRSKRAQAKMREMGFTRVVDLQGGFRAWVDENQPVVK